MIFLAISNSYLFSIFLCLPLGRNDVGFDLGSRQVANWRKNDGRKTMNCLISCCLLTLCDVSPFVNFGSLGHIEKNLWKLLCCFVCFLFCQKAKFYFLNLKYHHRGLLMVLWKDLLQQAIIRLFVCATHVLQGLQSC